MARIAYVANYYSADELKQKYTNQESVSARRWHLLWKVALGLTIKNSALAVGINYDYGKEIVNKSQELGEKGVTNLEMKPRKHRGGKKQLLTEEQLKQLALELDRPTDGGIWTGTKVARWLEKETGVEKVWNQRGWDYLKKLKFSWYPRAKHHKGDKSAQVLFKQNLPLKVFELREKYPEAEIELLFFDEHRVGLKPINAKSVGAPWTQTHCGYPTWLSMVVYLRICQA